MIKVIKLLYKKNNNNVNWVTEQGKQKSASKENNNNNNNIKVEVQSKHSESPQEEIFNKEVQDDTSLTTKSTILNDTFQRKRKSKHGFAENKLTKIKKN